MVEVSHRVHYGLSDLQHGRSGSKVGAPMLQRGRRLDGWVE